MSHQKKYKSIMGAKGLITAPNYLAELIITKRAKKKGLRLPDRIWQAKFKNDLQFKYWHNAYFGEVVHASKLLQQFDEDCIINALQCFECKYILTLRNKKLYTQAKILQEQKNKQLELQKQVRVEQKTSVTSFVTKHKTAKRTKLGKLT